MYLRADVSGKSDLLHCGAVHCGAVHDPFNKVKMGPSECDLPLPTAGQEAGFSQSRGTARKKII